LVTVIGEAVTPKMRTGRGGRAQGNNHPYSKMWEEGCGHEYNLSKKREGNNRLLCTKRKRFQPDLLGERPSVPWLKGEGVKKISGPSEELGKKKGKNAWGAKG